MPLISFWFSGVLRGYRKRPVALNGLKSTIFGFYGASNDDDLWYKTSRDISTMILTYFYFSQNNMVGVFV